MIRKRSLLGATAYWLTVVALCVGFAELSVRVWGLMPTYSLQAIAIPYQLRFKLDEKLLYRFTEDPAHSINDRGVRDHRFAKKPEGKKRVVVVGDSFPMGLVVAPQETFPKQLEALLPNAQVLNLGVQGYGPDQELLFLKEVGPSLDADLIVWSLFPPNDYNDLIKNRLFRLTPAGTAALNPLNSVSAVLPYSRTFMLLRFLTTGHFLNSQVEEQLHPVLFVDHEAPQPVSGDTVALMRAIMADFRDLAATLRAKLLAVVIPSFEQVQTNSQAPTTLNASATESLRTLGVQTVDLTAPFLNHPELYTDSEHHLSVAGHQKTAQSLLPAVSDALR